MTMTERGDVLANLQRLFDQGSASGMTDAQLLDRFLISRDETAFQLLLERHGRMVLGTCHAILHDPHEAEDAFQATFLVFVHKAKSIRGHDSLGGWLHRVAYNVALQANLDKTRRRMEEQRVAEKSSATTSESTVDPLLQAVIQIELGRLPEKFRLPVVLCDLEGHSREEAARQLQWTEGMVRGRLAQARERLRSRLRRRGIVLSGSALSAALGQEAAAAVPEAWMLTTSRAAIALALGAQSASLVSPRTMRFMKVTLGWMTSLKLKAAAAVMLVLALLGGAAAALTTQDEDQKVSTAPKTAGSRKINAPKAETKPIENKEFVFEGKVLGPDGQPHKDAHVFLLGPSGELSPDPRHQTKSDPQGNFHFSFPRSETNAESNRVVVTADGLGFGFSDPLKPGEPLTIRLVRDDVPIDLRVVDLQGKPVAGVTVRAVAFKTNSSEDLAGWLNAVQTLKSGFDLEQEHLPRWWQSIHLPLGFKPLVTGADGRVQIQGVGRERLVTLVIEGPEIESACVNVMTRLGATIRVPAYRGPGADNSVVYAGARFDHVAAPSRPVEGYVFDRKTKQPLAGVTIRSENPLPANPMTYVSTTTDEQGHYRLIGLPKGREGKILALPSDKQDYLHSRRGVEESVTARPLRLDFPLTAGVRIDGRVVDKSTGAPVQARVEYFVYADNPHLSKSPDFRWAMTYGTVSDEKGKFRLVALPGPGVVAARAFTDRYLMSIGAEKLPDDDHNGLLDTHPYSCVPSNYHILAAIAPPADSTALECTLALESGRTLTGTILDPNGLPLTGAHVSGLFEMGYWNNDPLPSSTFTLSGLRPGKPRFLQFFHNEKKLAGYLEVRGEETTPPRVKLQPWGVLTGRFVDDDGYPRKNVALVFGAAPKGAPRSGHLPGNGSGMSGRIIPDDSGRFRIEGLAPGLSYSLDVEEKGALRISWAIRGETIAPGEVKDLGDIQAKPINPKTP